MPKEHKKRGRREQDKKRKRELAEEDQNINLAEEEHESKRQRQSVADDDDQELFQGQPQPGETPYYGHLDEDEQEYFKRADQMLELNQFNDPEERSLFLENVYREADGKELKLASSQSCSRLMEKLIDLSTPGQLKTLFQKFNGQFLHLVQHRFASHCCEALFLRAAPIVTQELKEPPVPEKDEVFVSMENLYLYAIDELKEYLGYLMTDKFASHALRVLLFVLSGLPLSDIQTRALLQSKRKENSLSSSSEERSVPSSFSEALEKLITGTVAGLDTTYLRALAQHATGNPTLQLLVQLELTRYGKQRAKDETSIIYRLLPDDPIAEGTDSAIFINGLVYDRIGSRLLETILEYAPGKMFKTLYRHFFRERIGSLARNEIAGYVVSKILFRLSKEDLAEAIEKILPQFPNLIERGRTAVIKTLIERCVAREVDTTSIAAELETSYGGPRNFQIAKLLKLGEQDPDNQQQGGDKRHGSLLAQTMVNAPGRLSALIFDSLVRLDPTLSLSISRDPSASHVLQAALKSPYATIIYRRKIIQQFYGHIGEMAHDPSASHVIDSIWEGTHGLAFIRERVAEELAENEASLRESFVGRAVWKNWRMDLYKRRRADWVKQARAGAGSDTFPSFPEPNAARPKSAIELARERHAAKKKKTAAA